MVWYGRIVAAAAAAAHHWHRLRRGNGGRTNYRCHRRQEFSGWETVFKSIDVAARRRLIFICCVFRAQKTSSDAMRTPQQKA